ncbi:tRNA (adenine(58)-N(1))-methyltransferase non-catalytic subunit TRM6 [Halotydeus destructor]|nr:tRNA (adenine(58)-N(1))-methyltransferase non-catalytic subunit TRM6 [Halotydeus destructor]
MDQVLDVCVALNDHVLVEKLFDERTRITKVAKDVNFSFGTQRIDVSSLVGVKFDSVYELGKDKKFKPLQMSDDELYEIIGKTSTVTLDEVDDSKDNRFLNDDGKSQKMSRDDIEVLKLDGKTNQQIIDTLVENSSSFQQKNAFAQEKYLRKKLQKYSNLFWVRKPTLRRLVDMYHSQNSLKIQNMRIDTISQLLAAVNIRAGGHYIVLDNLIGLLTSAVLDRLYGDGKQTSSTRTGMCVQMYTDVGPTSSWRQCVEQLNISQDAIQRHLVSLPLQRAKNIVDKVPDEDKEYRERYGADGEGDDAKRKKFDERFKRRIERKVEEAKAIERLNAKSMDGLLIIIRQTDPLNILDILLPFLAPSANFAIYCSVIEPLAELLFELKNRDCINLRLFESWLRRYQVLPGRTRPEMNMSGSGGYILTGTKFS